MRFGVLWGQCAEYGVCCCLLPGALQAAQCALNIVKLGTFKHERSGGV